jgi:integrase
MASKFLLSDLQAKALKPGEKRKRLKDGGGLFLVVSPSGAKWFEFRYRFCGRETSIGLGGYPETSLAEARIKADDARKKLKDGENPSAERKAVKVSGMTFAEAAESYLKTRQESGLKDTNGIRLRLQKHVLPALGKIPLKNISTPQVLEAVLAIKKKREEMAKRCRTYCNQIYQHAIVRGWTDKNPVRELERLPELRRATPVKHQRAVKTPAELGMLLADIETIGHTLIGKALKLAPHVFVRASELAGMQWAEVDFKESLWRIPAERMKMPTPHLVPLSRQVRKQLEALRELTGWGLCVFPGSNGGQAPINPEAFRITLGRLGYGPKALVNSSHHGFRSVAATFLREKGFKGAWVEAQLAHKKETKYRPPMTSHNTSPSEKK